ncbi:MAG: orotidine-5'-phosphate decarboxylase [Verrucomicrobiaceae bacterium]|nr:MAG: orotidine-5'-phosphate decarboxylase [Verrucomicrobiaceae bacterium]
MRYTEKLARRIAQTGSHLCIGLDPRPDLIQGSVRDFLLRIVDETAVHAACFKPNIAYFEAFGSAGIALFEEVRAAIPNEIPVLLDAKRSDIGETQKYYAKAFFDLWNVDAVTLNPFLGFDSIEPFLDYAGRGLYLLAVTSNAGAADIELQELADGRQVFELVQDLARRAGGRAADVGYVLGLTNAADSVLSRMDDVPLLIPGLGAQGGDLAALKSSRRQSPPLINVSRGILYPPSGRTPAEAAGNYAAQIRAALAS